MVHKHASLEQKGENQTTMAEVPSSILTGGNNFVADVLLPRSNTPDASITNFVCVCACGKLDCKCELPGLVYFPCMILAR